MEYVLKVVSRKHEVFIITQSCVIGCSSNNTFKQLGNEFLNLATIKESAKANETF